MAEDFSDEDEALLAELGIEAETKQAASHTPREERIIAGFEDIQRFVELHGREPLHGEERDIFERLYAVRLERLRGQADCRALLQPLDHQGLLNDDEDSAGAIDLDDDELLRELGADEAATSEIAALRHVRSTAEKRAAEDIAKGRPCEDFARFKPLFHKVEEDLKNGLRTSRPFVRDAGFQKAEITEGQFFILGGQVAYVAKVGKTIKASNGEIDARLRVIYGNGTESDLLLRSLQRALYKDEAGRRITDPAAGPLFTEHLDPEDLASGTIYVLRSRSDHPTVAANREILHKIGVTGGDIARRLTNARHDATYLMADVEIVATYELFNINRTRLENLIHRVFAAARLDIEVKDRFGQPVIPREWFLVPLFVIDEAVARIKEGTITNFAYDPRTASLEPIS